MLIYINVFITEYNMLQERSNTELKAKIKNIKTKTIYPNMRWGWGGGNVVHMHSKKILVRTTSDN